MSSTANPLTSASLYELKFVSGPCISKGGDYAVAVHTHIHRPDSSVDESKSSQDTKAPEYRSQLFLYDLSAKDGGTGGAGEATAAPSEPLQLTHSGTKNTSPAFSPDGSQLAFLSNRPALGNADSDSAEPRPQQLCIMSLSGGEARAVTELKRGVSEFVWSPDGVKIAFFSRGEDKEPAADQPKEIDSASYKWDGAGSTPTVTAKIWVADLASGEIAEIYEPGFAPSSLTFAANGQALYFSAPPNAKAEENWYSHIFKVELPQAVGGVPEAAGATEEAAEETAEGGGATGEAAEERAVVHAETLFAPELRMGSFIIDEDEKTVLFYGESQPGFFSSPTALWKAEIGNPDSAERITNTDLELMPSVAGDSRYGKYTNSPVLLEPTAAASTVIANVNRKGHSGLAFINTTTGEVIDIHDPGVRVSVSGFVTDGASGRSIATIETPTTPGELFVIEADGAQKQLSHLNAEFVENYEPVSPSQSRWIKATTGPNGEVVAETDSAGPGCESSVEYWVMHPAKAREDNAMVIQVHGGPHANYGYGFLFEFQLLCARGYTVVYANPRASSSYGLDHAQAVLGAYGSVDADDVMAVASHAVANHIDPVAPVHLTGGSYGGFMTNWLTSQTTRYRSAVTQRSICNWLSMYGTSDIGPRFTELEVGGNPWEHTEKLWKQSPLAYVKNVETPTLIIHAESDFRCPMEQAEQWFTALKCNGVETKLVRYPDECHELSRSGRPDRRIHRLEAIITWFETHA